MYSDIKSAAKMIELYINAKQEKWSFNIIDLENKFEIWSLMGDITEVLDASIWYPNTHRWRRVSWN
jgi:hypothetical protein